MERVEYEKMYRFEREYWWYHGLHRLVRNAVRDHARGFRSLLDAGCGTGGVLRQLREEHPRARLVGIDVSRDGLGFCRDNGVEALVRCSVNDLGLRSGSFDVVTCQDVLYFEGIDESRAVGEIHRVLRDEGVLILNLPAFEILRGSHDRFVSTRRRFTRGEVRTLLQAGGFEIVWITYWNAALFPIVLFLRLVSRRGRRESDLRPLAPFWNRLLAGILKAEAAWLRCGTLPVGTSVFCAARKGSKAPAGETKAAVSDRRASSVPEASRS
jgi:ubiquinone/menaquinone biosynthesis C-methylase UbiE